MFNLFDEWVYLFAIMVAFSLIVYGINIYTLYLNIDNSTVS